MREKISGGGDHFLPGRTKLQAKAHRPDDISAVALGGEPEVLLGLAVLAQLLGRETQQLLVGQLPLVPLQRLEGAPVAAVGCKGKGVDSGVLLF